LRRWLATIEGNSNSTSSHEPEQNVNDDFNHLGHLVMSFAQIFNCIWILSVLLEAWLFLLCRRTESYVEIHVYVMFCLVRAFICYGFIHHCEVYGHAFLWSRYLAMPLRGMVAYGAFRSRRDRVWRGVLLGFIVGTGAEAACGLLKSYLEPGLGGDLDLTLEVVSRVFFCLMLAIWIEVFWSAQRKQKADRLFPKGFYASGD
jgi:hypothetical protein